MSSSNPQLYYSILRRPRLRFDYTSRVAVADSPLAGLNRYGAYTKRTFTKNGGGLSCALICPEAERSRVEDFFSAFKDGVELYPGFQQWFGLTPTEADIIGVKGISHEDAVREYGAAAERVISANQYDLVFVFIMSREGEPWDTVYLATKGRLTAGGLPSQEVVISEISKAWQFPWIVKNVAISSYAKIGGRPWVVDAEEDPTEIIIGIGQAKKYESKIGPKATVIGFTVVFKENGDFVVFKSVPPITGYDDYEEQLARLVTETIEEYSRREKQPTRIVLHIFKHPGQREERAIQAGLSALGFPVEYALLHVNSTSNFRLFDTSDESGTPPSGCLVRLGARNAVLLPEGRGVRGRTLVGVPHPLNIVKHKSSTIPDTEFPSFLQQIYNLAGVNWRGLNAKAVPATINYSRLIAQMAARLPAEYWSGIMAKTSLAGKAWFL